VAKSWHLKHGSVFAVLDENGWAAPAAREGATAGSAGPVAERLQGVFRRDTRYLDTWRVLVDGRGLYTLAVSQPSPNRLVIYQADPGIAATMSYGLTREITLDGASCRERVRLENTSGERSTRRVEIAFNASFEDIFEARGGSLPELRRRRIDKAAGRRTYAGRDGLTRHVLLESSAGPVEGPWVADLAPGEAFKLTLTIHLLENEERPSEHRAAAIDALYERWRERRPRIEGRLDEVVAQAWDDLQGLLMDGPEGSFPAAGVPRFVALFGRDTLTTGLFTVRQAPELSRSILLNLARLQGSEVVPAREEQPGKIIHEVRTGEAAALGLVPFARYYGTIDATPLFLCLAGEYLRVTGDDLTLRALQPHLKAAAAWMTEYGDPDGDGLLEFDPAGGGLVNQGWKDSLDSSAHRDGTLAEPPVALAEVQGYAYRAWNEYAAIAAAAGQRAEAKRAGQHAARIQARFEEAFWLPERGYYAMALDKDKRPLDVLASNQGHCLWAGIVSSERARRVADALMSPEIFTGWGLRTLAPGAARYNPVSYHNGSVWPHDSAFAAAGFSRYGLVVHARKLATALLETGLAMSDHRLPELFAGYPRRARVAPVAYPQASVPQAWDAGAAIHMAQLLLELGD
jgi:glycogen debranching enzyme